MDNMPLVSVIIPTYKSDVTLGGAINSALNQTYTNIEIIVIDDNNPGTIYRQKSESIMEEYIDNSKVFYIRHKNNKNGAAARNTGFRNSRGEYICFLDDDDVYLEAKIEKQLEYLENSKQFQAVYCWRYQNGRIIKYSKTGDLSEELLSLSFTPYTSSIMLRRECYEAIGGFNEAYRRHQDFEFLLRFFEFYTIGVVEEPLIEIKGNQVNNAVYGIELEKLKIQFLSQFSHHIDRINEKKKDFKKLVFARHYSTVFWSYCRNLRIGSAVRVFFKYSIVCGPVFWKSVLIYLMEYFEVKRKIYVKNKT